MDLQEKQQYKIEPEAFWEAGRMVDGFDRQDLAAKHGKPPWRAVSSWGRDGWDLGKWPYVVFYFREVDGDKFQYATNVEGDVYAWSFPTEEMRNTAVDAEALWYWQNQGESWVQRYREGREPYSVDTMPAKLRGPFSWERLEREKDTDKTAYPKE